MDPLGRRRCVLVTLVHELIHWTGGPARLDRDTIRGYHTSKQVRAKEELIAELGAAFHLADIGRASVPRPDQAEYLAGWLKALENDTDLLWEAASVAQRASNDLTRRHTEKMSELTHA